MPFDLTILKKKIEGLKEAFENGNFADALVGAMETGRDEMKLRIFDKNTDIEGNGFGKYVGVKKKATDRALFLSFGNASKTDQKRIKRNADLELTSYQRKRANKGRQIDHKDLQFMFGLRKSIETQDSIVRENEHNVRLEFSTLEAAKIARGQENQITNLRTGKGTTKGNGVKIFRLTRNEKDRVIDTGVELITQILKK